MLNHYHFIISCNSIKYEHDGGDGGGVHDHVIKKINVLFLIQKY